MEAPSTEVKASELRAKESFKLPRVTPVNRKERVGRPGEGGRRKEKGQVLVMWETWTHDEKMWQDNMLQVQTGGVYQEVLYPCA